jgi:hypothetical protein
MNLNFIALSRKKTFALNAEILMTEKMGMRYLNTVKMKLKLLWLNRDLNIRTHWSILIKILLKVF